MSRRSLDHTALELLVGIADSGSLSAAGRLVGMAQPNASRHITQLERKFGMTLVRRSTTGSVLTSNGVVVAHWARKILADMDKLLEAVDGLRAERSRGLRVSASMTVAEHLMPLWLGRFRQSHPDLTIHLEVQNSLRVFEQVSDGSCELGFVESPEIPNQIRSVPVARDCLVVVVHPEHVWATRGRPVGAAELATTPLIVREPGSGTRTTLDVALERYPRCPPLLELGSSGAIRSSVLAGVGPAVLSALAVADRVASGGLVVVDVEGLDLERTLRAVWSSQGPLHPAAGELIGLASDFGGRRRIDSQR
ncbi:LysR family transcriptional regulator [Rhodococcus sp. AG1013]|uniref:LysR family transcriptional regulator n=1 Tax=Rhodococcus sp. AG1013 TaxID=2183996 RepID=UPI000E0AE837|nr:LysR family transcriptional regulator [Rhodococcus sp. AG1013]RDI35536.1 LysR family transcriptional regulator [Rhodococcus sp. AG1013]